MLQRISSPATSAVRRQWLQLPKLQPPLVSRACNQLSRTLIPTLHNCSSINTNRSKLLSHRHFSTSTPQPDLQQATSEGTINILPNRDQQPKPAIGQIDLNNTDNDPKLLTAFTCNKCQTRSAKLISKQAYNHGVVIIRCPSCSSNHLFSDHLGWFDDTSQTIESICQEHGIEVQKVTDGSQISDSDRKLMEGAQQEHERHVEQRASDKQNRERDQR